MENLNHLSNLKTLDVSGCKFSNQGLQQLPENIEYLGIEYCPKITSNISTILSRKLKKLKKINK